MEKKGRHVSQERLEQLMKENFKKWGKAYEMLAVGEEPEKDEETENEL